MNQAQAETAVTGAALVVGGVYIYRRLSEPETQLQSKLPVKQLAGQGPVLPIGPFVVGWGFTFLVLSLMAQANPSLGGNFAVLAAAGAILGNGEAVFQDAGKQLGGSSTKSAGAATPTTVAPATTSDLPQYPGRVVVRPGFPVAPTATH